MSEALGGETANAPSSVNEPLTLTLESHLDSLAALDEGIEGFATRYDLPRAIAFDLRLVLEELFVNVVNYASEGGGVPVSIRLRRDATAGVLAELRDGGPPFDPIRRIAAGIPAPGESEGGYGLYLVGRKTRDLAYERLEGGLNRVTFSIPVADPDETAGN